MMERLDSMDKSIKGTYERLNFARDDLELIKMKLDSIKKFTVGVYWIICFLLGRTLEQIFTT